MPGSEKTQATGGESAPERFLDRHLGNVVHLFLTLLAILILVAAGIATVRLNGFGNRPLLLHKREDGRKVATDYTDKKTDLRRSFFLSVFICGSASWLLEYVCQCV